MALSAAFTLSLDLDGVAVALVALAALEVERLTLGGGTGVLATCELDTAGFVDFSFLLLDLVVLARLVVCAGVAAGSFSELLSPLLLVSSPLLSAGCLRFRSPPAADFFPLADEAGATAGASAISSSDSLLEESEAGLAWGLLAPDFGREASDRVGWPIGVNRARRPSGCSLTGLILRTYSSVAVELIRLAPPNSAMRRMWTVESTGRLTKCHA